MTQKEKNEDTRNVNQLPKRKIHIETDGKNFDIKESQVSLLELREICRQILARTGGL